MSKLPPTSKKNYGIRRSQRDYSEARACTPKIPFATWDDAEDAIQRMISENIDAGVPWKSRSLSAYLCTFYRHWHVGHSAGPVDVNSIPKRLNNDAVLAMYRRAGVLHDRL